MANPKPIPSGYHTITPSIIVSNAKAAIEYYKRAFGAEEIMPPMLAPGSNKVLHAELKIGDSPFFITDENPAMGARSPQSVGGTSVSLYIYTPDVDKVFDGAVKAGGKAVMPPADMFWGDRFGTLIDPFGHQWGLATHVEDVSPQDMEKRQAEFFRQQAQQAKSA